MSSNTSHSYFEELCALAAIGQISSTEYAELSDHLRECGACRSSYSEFARLTHADLPLAASRPESESAPVGVISRLLSKRYKSRFIGQAHQYGLNIADPSSPGAWTRIRALSIPLLSFQSASAVAMLVLLAFAGTFFHRWKNAENQAAHMAAQVSIVTGENSDLERKLTAVSHEKEVVQADLSRGLDDRGQLMAQLTQVEDRSAHDKLMLENDQAELQKSVARTKQTEQALRDAQQKLAALSRQTEELRASRSDNETALAAEQIQVAELSRRLKDQDEVIQKQQKLMSVDTDVRNLMAARNLHITDVFDVDVKGKKKPAFGRVFYTEGRSLLFYAFDLDAPRLQNAKHSFQAWGQLADGSTAAVNLGIFYIDDPAQKRWLLKFDNPEVLKEISAVFVTAEPHGGKDRPTGQKLMYAYLGHEPNHP